MRPSAALALLCVCSPALAGHFDDVIDPHAKPTPCTPDTAAFVPNCPSKTAVADDDDRRDVTVPPDAYSQLAVHVVAARVAQQSRDDDPPAGAPPPREPDALVLDDHALRWQGEVAVGFGDAVVDGTNVTSYPSLNLAGGVASGRFAALATYTLTGEHYPGSSTAAAQASAPAYLDTDGIVHRLGVAGRYAVLHGSNDLGLLGDLWLQGDGGAEFTRWDRGGLLERPYVGIALGTQGGLASSAHKRHSFYLAVRVQIARRTDLNDSAATCSAPCTEATAPERWSDRSIELRVGFAFGD